MVGWASGNESGWGIVGFVVFSLSVFIRGKFFLFDEVLSPVMKKNLLATDEHR